MIYLIFHSMNSADVARMTVNLGDHNIRTTFETQHVVKKVKRVVRHRSFDSRTLYNDIALLTLESPVQYSSNIRPICLPRSSHLYGGNFGTVIGWGSLRESMYRPSDKTYSVKLSWTGIIQTDKNNHIVSFHQMDHNPPFCKKYQCRYGQMLCAVRSMVALLLEE